MQLPAYSQIVICGGGIAGASAAYHLTQLGLNDVTVIERHQLTSGTTWHAAGLIMQLRATHTLTEMAKYNVELYSGLESETGQPTGFRQNGTLGVCRTRDRLIETLKVASIAKTFGIEAHIISPGEAKDIYPAIDAGKIVGAIYIPKDGQTNPVDTTLSLVAGARQRGARIVENCKVETLDRLASHEFHLTTSQGSIRCETLVLACGLWTRALAAQLGVAVPLHACEHSYIVTEPIAAATNNLPVLRDTDGCNYVKVDAGKWLIGAFEPTGKPVGFDTIPDNVPFIEFPEDWNQFELPFNKAMELLPDLRNAGIGRFLNGPESFTPDLLFALGEAPGQPNCFISAGYNSEGIELNPAAGKILAQWIADGKPPMDLGSVDIARFHPVQSNTGYLRARSAEVIGLHYKMNWPHKQKTSARSVRKSVLHDRWATLNAHFGEAMAWERPLWFAPVNKSNMAVYSHSRPNWFEYVATECKAARQSAIILDQSSLGKFLVQGRNAVKFLQTICAADIDVPIGRIVYSQMLNERGGIESDVTINRLDEHRFMIVSSATSQPRDRNWIEQQLLGVEHVFLTDVTSCYSVISIQGPASRKILSNVSTADFSNNLFPFATSRKIEVGHAFAIANRLTFVGQLGWELFVETDCAQHVFDRIMETATNENMKPAGYHALEHLRCEHAYREFDLDLSPEDTPIEAGLGYATAPDRKDFIGRSALLRQLESDALSKRLVLFRLTNPEPVMFGEEPILLDGTIVGYTSSGAYGFTLGAACGMGYVNHPDGVTEALIDSGHWEIEIACERHPANASLKPFVDPRRTRVYG